MPVRVFPEFGVLNAALVRLEVLDAMNVALPGPVGGVVKPAVRGAALDVAIFGEGIGAHLPAANVTVLILDAVSIAGLPLTKDRGKLL